MDFGGIIIIVAALTLFGTIPLLVARKTAMMQTREGDRYSQRLRVLKNSKAPNATAECDRSTGQLLAVRRVVSPPMGVDMADESKSRPQVRVHRPAVESVSEIARLRARRAARLSVEAAAGRRRLLVSAILTLATAIVGITAAMTALSWLWALLPAGLLGVSLVASRMAAIRSEKANEAELQLLAHLRARAGKTAVRPAVTPADVVAVEDPQTSGVSEVAEDAAEDSAADSSEDVAEGLTEELPQADAAGAEPAALFEIDEIVGAGDEVSAEISAEAADAAPAVESTASVERRTWTVGAVPAPSYAMRARVTGRVVHLDTDLRGIPRIDGVVPARPVATTGMKAARSTAATAADAICAFDLDAVLDARRAQ